MNGRNGTEDAEMNVYPLYGKRQALSGIKRGIMCFATPMRGHSFPYKVCRKRIKHATPFHWESSTFPISLVLEAETEIPSRSPRNFLTPKPCFATTL